MRVASHALHGHDGAYTSLHYTVREVPVAILIAAVFVGSDRAHFVRYAQAIDSSTTVSGIGPTGIYHGGTANDRIGE